MDSLSRINKLKNAVMRRIVEIRQMKAKPKLSALLTELRDVRLKDKSLSEEEKNKIRLTKRRNLRKKIVELYDDSVEQLGEAEELVKDIKVVQRKSEAQWEMLATIEKQIKLLSTAKH
jgi:hypothetical protein